MNFKDERMKEIMRMNYLLVITISRVNAEQDFIPGTILWAKGQSNSPCKSFRVMTDIPFMSSLNRGRVK